jgi:hypothetical protein
VPHQQSKIVRQQFSAVYGNLIFQSLSSILLSDMVGTHSSHPLHPPPSASRSSNNPKMMEFLKSMAESMEVLRKQNEDLNTRLTAAKTRSNQKERVCEGRHEK